MKKALVLLLTLALVLSFAACSSKKSGEIIDNMSSIPEGSLIDGTRAQEIALAHAGAPTADIKNFKIDYDIDDGVESFEIEFRYGNVEYEYDINAKTGEIIKAEKNDKAILAPADSSNPAPVIKNEPDVKAIALAHAGVKAADIKGYRVELDIDKGVKIYEIEFYVGKDKYEYDIKAADGKILEAEKNDKSLLEATYKKIGEARAKEIALEHAGVKEADIKGYRIEFDVDDGVPSYEIEFISGGFEYEYDINASTGAIIKSEKDRD